MSNYKLWQKNARCRRILILGAQEIKQQPLNPDMRKLTDHLKSRIKDREDQTYESRLRSGLQMYQYIKGVEVYESCLSNKPGLKRIVGLL